MMPLRACASSALCWPWASAMACEACHRARGSWHSSSYVALGLYNALTRRLLLQVWVQKQRHQQATLPHRCILLPHLSELAFP